MASCDIALQLDQRSVRLGGELTGTVRVTVDEDCDCRALELTTRWETDGHGETVRGTGPAGTLFSGRWRAGQQIAYPFRLPAPKGPCSYDGQLIKLHWQAEASADIPWALDPRDRQRFALKPAPVADYYRGRHTGPRSHIGGLRLADQQARLLLSGLVTLVPFISLVQHLAHGPFSGWRLLLELAVITGGVAIAAYRPLLNALAARRIGRVRVRLSARTVAPGETLEVEVRASGGRGDGGRRVEAELLAEEIATYRRPRTAGERRRRLDIRTRRVWHDTERRIAETRVSRRGSSLRAQLAFTVPSDAPPSLALQHNELRWKVTVRLLVPDWPDWQQSHDLIVVPAPSMPAPGTPAAARRARQDDTATGRPRQTAPPAAGAAQLAPTGARPRPPDPPPAGLTGPPAAEPAPLAPLAAAPALAAAARPAPAGGQAFAVAVTRWARPPAREAAALGPALGMTAYDFRLKFAGPLPLVIGQHLDAAAAGALVAPLAERGHGVITLDMRLVPPAGSLFEVREFRTTPDALQLADRRGQRLDLAWDEIQALIRAVYIEDRPDAESSQAPQPLHRSDGERLADMGGARREQVLYAIPRDATRSALLRENAVRYEGLGTNMQQTRQQNFATLVETLRHHAPAAFYDDRLNRAAHTQAQSAISAVLGAGDSADTPVAVTDLLVQVLLAAQLQGQL